MNGRRPLVAVIGNGTPTPDAERVAEALGKQLVESGFRIVTGGLGGVMAAASRGAHQAGCYREGDVLGILPGPHADAANSWVDIVLPSNLGFARNVLVVSSADAVVAVGGGAGTLTEIAMAWQLGKPVIGLDVPGWSQRLGGTAVDERRADVVLPARDAAEAVALVNVAIRARRDSALGDAAAVAERDT
jgi:uncharacterized protein (TIGR00725 family)